MRNLLFLLAILSVVSLSSCKKDPMPFPFIPTQEEATVDNEQESGEQQSSAEPSEELSLEAE